MDDDIPVYASLSLLLSQLDIQLTLFRSFDKLVQAIEHSAPDCLLIEYNLQLENGLLIYEGLEYQTIDPPTIFLSTYSDITIAVRVIPAGAFYFIEKLFTESRILTSIKQLIDTSHSAKI
jgi:FixJ family two-component response regulator